LYWVNSVTCQDICPYLPPHAFVANYTLIPSNPEEPLEQESDPNVIAKKLTNKIFNSIGRRIPVVQDVSCLERELLNLKFDLGVEKLAIALYSKRANEVINQLCQSLTDSIQICPFTGEKSTQRHWSANEG